MTKQQYEALIDVIIGLISASMGFTNLIVVTYAVEDPSLLSFFPTALFMIYGFIRLSDGVKNSGIRD